jgi:hypothetical protein
MNFLKFIIGPGWGVEHIPFILSMSIIGARDAVHMVS